MSKLNFTPLVLSALLAFPAVAVAGQQDVNVDPASPSTIALEDVSTGESVQPDARASEPQSSNRLVEEIIVTAQKREENIQEVPLAITAFSADKLEALGIQTVQELERITPGLTVTNAGGFSLVYLRGVGTDAFLPGADPSVPFYLDGVPLLGGQGTSDTVGRVERIEVLKGPQGTLFGRNATGGAVNVITPNPDDEVVADVGFEFGNYNQRKMTAYMNVPMSDSFAFSVALNASEQDNFYVNDGPGGVPDVYSHGGRVKARLLASDDISITLAAALQKASGNGGLNFENTRVAPVFAGFIPEDPKADRHLNTDDISLVEFDSRLMSATVDWHFGWVDAKVIGSDQILKTPVVQSDFDKSYLPIVNLNSDGASPPTSKQRTLELQFLSNDETPYSEKTQWVAGLFYLKSSGGYDPIAFELAPGAINSIGAALTGTARAPLFSALTNTLNGLVGPLGIDLNNGIRILNGGVLESEAYSAYLQGTYHFTDRFNATAGLRYQSEDRDLKKSRLAVPSGNGGETVLRRDSVPTLHAKQLSPRIALQLLPFDNDAQIYTSWSRAFKSPTYNTVNLLGGLPTTIGGVLTGSLEPPEIKPVKEERVDSYELGIKTDLFNRNLRVNSAAFYTRQKNLLTGFVGLTTGGIVSYDNVPRAEIKGVEADVLWTPLPGLNDGLAITAAGTMLDAKYTDYPNGKGFDEATGLAFGDGDTTPLSARDFKGNRIVRTPKSTYNLGINQSISLSTGTIEFGADVNHQGKFFFLPQNSDLYARAANTVYNARVTYLYEPWSTQIGLFCNNLTDTTYNEIVFVDDFGRNQILNSPRTFGLRAKLSF